MPSDFIDEIKARDYSALSSGPNVITEVTTFKRERKAAVRQTAVQTEKARDPERDELCPLWILKTGEGGHSQSKHVASRS